jgi:hypothetical protein
MCVVQSKPPVVMTERFMFGFGSVFVIYPDGHGGLGLSSSRLMSLPSFFQLRRKTRFFFFYFLFSLVGWLSMTKRGRGLFRDFVGKPYKDPAFSCHLLFHFFSLDLRLFIFLFMSYLLVMENDRWKHGL